MNKSEETINWHLWTIGPQNKNIQIGLLVWYA